MIRSDTRGNITWSDSQIPLVVRRVLRKFYPARFGSETSCCKAILTDSSWVEYVVVNIANGICTGMLEVVWLALDTGSGT